MRSLVRPVLKESANQNIPLPNKRAASPDQRPPRPSDDQKRAPKQGRIASFGHGGDTILLLRPNSTDGWHEFERMGSTSSSGLDWRVAPIQTHGWHQLDVRPWSTDGSTDGWPQFLAEIRLTGGTSSLSSLTVAQGQVTGQLTGGPGLESARVRLKDGTSSPTTQVGMTGGTSLRVAPIRPLTEPADAWLQFGSRWLD